MSANQGGKPPAEVTKSNDDTFIKLVLSGVPYAEASRRIGETGNNAVKGYNRAKRLKQRILEEKAQNLQAGGALGYQVIKGLAQNTDTPPSVQLQAAVKLVDLADKGEQLESDVTPETIKQEIANLLGQHATPEELETIQRIIHRAATTKISTININPSTSQPMSVVLIDEDDETE